MRRSARLLLLCVVALFPLAGCSYLEDNGTHLAYALEHGAEHLRHSNQTEEVVEYEPLTGINQRYEIDISETIPVPKPNNLKGLSSLTVTGKNPGSTSYHSRFVTVPKHLYIAKENASAEIVLRKHGDNIDVVAIR
jgi:hypothetical protein